MNGVGNPIEKLLADYPLMILDGALATELERHGCNLDDPLWSARVLLEQPEMIYKVHLAYYRAGADCSITSSYQATVDGFLKRGLSEQEALALIGKTVELARRARDDFWQEWQQQAAGMAAMAAMEEASEAAGARAGLDEGQGVDAARASRPRPLVAASVGPYGAYLADGSEYVGHYGVTDEALEQFHRPRLAALIAAGADVLAMETIPSLQEARVLARLLQEWPDAYAWMSFSLRDAQSISEGTPLAECAAELEGYPQIAAVGLNCAPAAITGEAVKTLRASTSKPIIVYPNSGEVYDAQTKTWHSGEHEACGGIVELDAQAWYEAGARIIGGCCRTSPEHIEAIARRWRG